MADQIVYIREQVAILQAQIEVLNVSIAATANALEKMNQRVKRRIALDAAASIRTKFSSEKMEEMRNLSLMLIARVFDIPSGSLAN
jgi:prefoldin subunit 5